MAVRRLAFAAGLLGVSLALFAKVGGNTPYAVTTNGYSAIYARCVPAETKGSKGTTQILRVAKDGDEVIATFDWYNPSGLALGWSPTAGKVAVMRYEQEAGLSADKQVEFSFYLGTALVRAYTTAELEKLGATVQADYLSTLHGVNGLDGSTPQRAQYHVDGCFQVLNTNDYYFRVNISSPNSDEKLPAKVLMFDVVTGKPCRVELVPNENKERMTLLEP